MEDFLSMIVLMIIYIAAAAVNGKKKKKQKTRRGNPAEPRRMRSKAAERAYGASASSAEKPSARTAENVSAGFAAAFEEDCDDRSIHLHDVPQSVMRSAGEGEDPCHAGGANTARESAEVFESILGAVETERETLMQDMLRGVIMSEILTRPCERRAAERNRRSYHG